MADLSPVYRWRGTSGPILALIHGYPLDHTLWHGQASLGEHCRLLTFDLPGFGSAIEEPLPRSIGDYANSVERVLTDAGAEKVILGGLSMGGYIAFECYRRFPQRIAGLLLCDTRAEADSAEARQVRDSSIAAVHNGQRVQLLDAMLDKLLAPGSRTDENVVSAARAMMERASDEGIIAALGCMRDRPDSRPTLGTVNVPTLVVVGSEDTLTPPDVARTMQQGIREAQLCTIGRAGHLAPLEQPAAFNAAVVSWLESVYTP